MLVIQVATVNGARRTITLTMAHLRFI